MQQQNQNLLKNLCFIIAFSSMMITVLSLCDSCQQNGISCVNETHFKVCIDEEPLDSVLYCGDGKICADITIGCIEENDAIKPSCPKSSGTICNGCDGNALFACTSRTTFVMCNGETEGDQILTCPDNKFCDINSGKFCVEECEISSFECDVAAA